MLINSQPQSQLADFTKFALIAKNRQLNDFSAVLRNLRIFALLCDAN